MLKSLQVLVSPYHLCAQIIKITWKLLCIGGEIHTDMDKIWRMCHFCVLLYSVHVKHETVRNQLISYLTFILVNWNLETTNELTSYSVKVHSTSAVLIFILQFICTWKYNNVFFISRQNVEFPYHSTGHSLFAELCPGFISKFIQFCYFSQQGINYINTLQC